MKREKINNVTIWKYYGFNIVRTGTKDYPWNVYFEDGHGFGEWVACGATLKECKEIIDNGIF